MSPRPFPPRPQRPRAAPPTTVSTGLHPRNRHQGRYDFPALIQASPELARFVITNPYGNRSIDFADPAAVRVFNRALLRLQYGIEHWDIPSGYLCPPIPGRADYLHGLADLLAEDLDGRLPRGPGVQMLDVGTGANCIYPLLGQREYGWRFIGSDIDTRALAAAREILRANRLEAAIELRHQGDAACTLTGVLQPGESCTATLCNPPFHASAAEAIRGSQRKWRNLGKQDPTRRLPTLNFGGQANELWCPGGELAFLRRLAKESHDFAQQVVWFSTLVSKGGNVAALETLLARLGARDIRCCAMGQGQKRSRFVAWSFLDRRARQTRLQQTIGSGKASD